MKRTLLALALLAATSGAAIAQQSMPMGQGAMGGMPGMNHGQMPMNGQMLTASDPADGASLAQAPRTLTLTFMHPVLLQTVSVTGPGNTPIAATFPPPANAATNYSIDLPALASGDYAVAWSASGVGHEMRGTLSFTVQ